MVLEEDVALWGLAEFIAIFELAFCDCRSEFLASSFVLEDFSAVEIMLCPAALGDDANRIPLPRRIGLSAGCGNEVVEVRQIVRAF